MADKKPTSFRLSPEALRLLARLAKETAVSQTSVLEVAIRQMAKREGVA